MTQKELTRKEIKEIIKEIRIEKIQKEFESELDNLITKCLDIQFASATFDEISKLRDQFIQKWKPI